MEVQPPSFESTQWDAHGMVVERMVGILRVISENDFRHIGLLFYRTLGPQ